MEGHSLHQPDGIAYYRASAAVALFCQQEESVVQAIIHKHVYGSCD